LTGPIICRLSADYWPVIGELSVKGFAVERVKKI
jgi:hypothetical protein